MVDVELCVSAGINISLIYVSFSRKNRVSAPLGSMMVPPFFVKTTVAPLSQIWETESRGILTGATV